MQTCRSLSWHQLHSALLYSRRCGSLDFDKKCHSRFHHLWCSNSKPIAPRVARSLMKNVWEITRDSHDAKYNRNSQAQGVFISAQLKVPKWTALITACASTLLQIFPRFPSYVVHIVVHSLLTGDRGYVALILFKIVQGGWMPPWSCSSISWGLKLVKLLMTCILGWDCIAMCVWNLRIFVSELYRYDLALQITTLDNLSWSNGHQKTRTHHIFPGFWITTLLHCNAPLL